MYNINFGDLPGEYSEKETSAFVIIPVPYDGTSTWMKGADKGPLAILEASCNMELYDIETDSEAYLQGIYTAPPVTENESPSKMVDAVYKEVKKYLEAGKFPVVTGGEHSVSIGSIKAFAEHFQNISVLQLDAHSDLRTFNKGSKYNHGCVMARAKELCPIVQVGIRSMDISEKRYYDRDRIFFAHKIMLDDKWMEKAVEKLTENVYITIDLDVFDTSVMPSTGTPEPGGIGWYMCNRFIEKVVRLRNVVGFDVVELCPNNANKAPDFFASKLIYRTMSMITSYKKRNKK